MNDVRRFLRAEWDRVVGYGCLAVGVVLLVAGFVGVRSSADVIDEISYLVTGGIGPNSPEFRDVARNVVIQIDIRK